MRRFLLAFFVLSGACGGGTPAEDGTAARMDFTRASGFFSAPFPSDDLRVGAKVQLSGFPNPRNTSIVTQSIALLERDARGFSTTGAIFFSMTAPIDATKLPTLEGSTQASAPVFLVSVDSNAPDYLKRYPVETSFLVDGGPHGAPNLLSMLPLQGVPLRPQTRYAAVVLRSLGDAAGKPLAQAAAVRAIAGGQRPAGLPEEVFASYRGALTAVVADGIPAADIAALTVFTTDDPTAQMATVRADVLSRQLPQPKAAWKLDETFPDYCVYSTTIDMPVYQRGTPPYTSSGGDWTFDNVGQPALQRNEEATVFATVPRKAMPAGGFRTVIFVRAGGGGDRPIVDRGRRTETGGDAVVAGSGPAMLFAQAGFAGLSIDGPLGGKRNPNGADENSILWNITNGAALRDNLRQSALETILAAHLLDTFTIDSSGCPGAPAQARFDGSNPALMGHSNGATIAPLALAYEPRFRAAILSGAGASWIENVVYKRKPLPVRDVAELLLGYPLGTLHVHDPVLTLVQWAAEPADPQVYNRRIVVEPPSGYPARHILMLQGIVDNYILPRIANATSLSLGLDLAGDPLDAPTVPGLEEQMPLADVLPLAGRKRVSLPASANAASGTTAVVVQHLGDDVEDGHEVVFQRDEPKYQYRCFLASLAASGTPSVPPPATLDTACP